MRLRQLLASLQKDNAMQSQNSIAKSLSQRTEPTGVAPRPPVQEKQIVAQLQEEKKRVYHIKIPTTRVCLCLMPGQSMERISTNIKFRRKKLQSDASNGQSQQRSGPQEILKPHERLFRQRTKSMIIAENIEKRFGKHGQQKKAQMITTKQSDILKLHCVEDEIPICPRIGVPKLPSIKVNHHRKETKSQYGTAV